MNVASLDLCRELYEVSGWLDPDAEGRSYVPGAPYYSLGYLLRRLPRPTAIFADWPDEHYSAEYQHSDRLDDERLHVHGMDTPEDAACRLAIELFRQGILPKADHEGSPLPGTT